MVGFGCEGWECVGLVVLGLLILALAGAMIIVCAWAVAAITSAQVQRHPVHRNAVRSLVAVAFVLGGALGIWLVAIWFTEPISRRLVVFVVPIALIVAARHVRTRLT